MPGITIKKAISISGFNESFRTHLNYLKTMEYSMGNFSIQPKNTIACFGSPKEKSVRKLLDLSMQSLANEADLCIKFDQYAYASLAWLPVKAYYITFYANALLLSCIYQSDRWLSESHLNVIKEMKKLFTNKSLISISNDFASSMPMVDVDLIKTSNSHANLRNFEIAHYKDLLILLKKKIFEFKVEEYRRKYGIKRLTKKEKLSMIAKYKDISLLEFFYWYRIKSNYRDLEYLSANLLEKDVKEYVKTYLNCTINYVNAICKLI